MAGTRSSLALSVRFTDGCEDIVDLWVGQRETVRDVKARIRLLRPALERRQLRLIHNGRVLYDNHVLLPMVSTMAMRTRAPDAGHPTWGPASVGSLLNSAVSNAARSAGGLARSVRVIAQDGGRSSDHAAWDSGPATADDKGKRSLANGHAEVHQAIWLHCAVGDAITAEDPGPGHADEHLADQPPTTDPPQIVPLRGFDRLTDAGLSADDIEELRRQFHTEEAAGATEDDDEAARALEDQWLEGLNAAAEDIQPGRMDTYSNLLKNAAIGFFLPAATVFFDRSTVFADQPQLAIILGAILNVGFGVMRFLNSG